MTHFVPRTLATALLVGTVLCGARPAAAQLADVFLKNGLKLRGDVTTVDDTVVVKNTAGEMRVPRADVERIVPVESASQPTAAPTPVTLPATRETATQPATRAELPPALPLSDEDIQRLKIGELRLDGPPENLRVRFARKGKQRDLSAEVLDELRQRPDFRPEWEEVLLRGSPSEKLQLIVRTTDAEHVDRIAIENDPAVFATFRRRVLPLVDRGCARSGCHAGHAARVFRFPTGSPSSDTYVYTTFVLLDQMKTADGPLLDRDDPEGSVLLRYMLPQKGDETGHPPVSHGPAFQAAIRDRDDRLYATVLDWINGLRMPHPDYGLTYKNPYAGQPATQPEGEPEEPGQPPGAPP
jgi:sRNA-binding regulator protein Hfq